MWPSGVTCGGGGRSFTRGGGTREILDLLLHIAYQRLPMVFLRLDR